MFQIACAASNRPPRSPTRGSGFGAAADIDDAAIVEVAAGEVAHDAAETRRRASGNEPTATARFMRGLVLDFERGAGRNRTGE
jgi:hypothetical protein